MKRFITVVACSMILVPASVMGVDFEYASYASLLKHRVTDGVAINGITVAAVDYNALWKDARLPSSDYSRLLKELAAFDPDALNSREERIAFWVNVYNIGAMKTIVDHYPVDSIRSRKIHWRGSPWDTKVIRVGARNYALDEIEHTILLDGFGDLRIHFGINCASVSCADLLTVPYRAATLYRQLEQQGKRLLANRDKGLRIDRERNTVFLSRIFKFDAKRFAAFDGGVLTFIRPFVVEGDGEFLYRTPPKIGYLDYDWSANDLKNASPRK